jgi:hypothetical protein
MYNGAWREQMRQVSKENAEKSIADCHWINPGRSAPPQQTHN